MFIFVVVKIKLIFFKFYFSTFDSSFIYYLNWHYNHLVYENKKSLLLRQHAAALLNTISSNNYCPDTIAGKMLTMTTIDCCSKWLNAAKLHGILEV